MKINENIIMNGNALNDAKDDPYTRGYKLSCLLRTDNNIEILYGVELSYTNIKSDSFMIIILYPNGKYKIVDTFQYEDLYTDKIQKIGETVLDLVKEEVEEADLEKAFCLLCGTVNQIRYIRDKTEKMDNSKLISAKEASDLYGISCDAARNFMKNHGATKYGREWMLQKEVFNQHYREK